jgi:hypothetical protein
VTMTPKNMSDDIPAEVRKAISVVVSLFIRGDHCGIDIVGRSAADCNRSEVSTPGTCLPGEPSFNRMKPLFKYSLAQTVLLAAPLGLFPATRVRVGDHAEIETASRFDRQS